MSPLRGAQARSIPHECGYAPSMRRQPIAAALAVVAVGAAPVPTAAAAGPDVRVRIPVVTNAAGERVVGFRRERVRRVTVTFRVVNAPPRRRLRAWISVGLERRVDGRLVARYVTSTRRIGVETGRWRWVVPVRVPPEYPLGVYRMRVRVALHRPTRRWRPITSASRVQPVRLRARGRT